MSVFRHVKGIVKKSIPRILLGLVLLLLVDLLQLYVPILSKNAIDKIQTLSITRAGLALVALQILGLTVGIMVTRFFWRIIIIGNSFIIEKKIRHNFYAKLMRLSQNFFSHSKIGDLMAYATNDLNAVRMLFGFAFIAGFDAIVMSLMSLAFMSSISTRLTLYAIIPLPLLSLLILFFGKKVHKRFDDVQKSFSTMSGQIQESITGIRVIKAFNQEQMELDSVKKTSTNYVKKNINLALLDGIFHPSIGLVISTSLLITTVVGGELTIKGTISVGDFYAFNSYLGMLIWPMIAVGMVVNQYQRGTASLKRLNKIFDKDPEVSDIEADFSIKRIQGKLDIKDLTYSYPESEEIIFDKISTTIEQGKVLAIVGRTGCGKTTLIDLLARVYNPPKDSIFIDNHDIHTIPIEVLHKNVVMVPQDIFLFSDSIANNIAMGKPNASRKEIENVTKLADVYNDILEFDKGFDTVVGERGVTLSGGQKQRVAIARALLCDPQILILDDSLSAVDTLTEKNILNELFTERKDKTTIIISHRISAVSKADKIIVIDNNHIVESGTHDELINKGGIYQDLEQKQKIEERLEGEDK